MNDILRPGGNDREREEDYEARKQYVNKREEDFRNGADDDDREEVIEEDESVEESDDDAEDVEIGEKSQQVPAQENEHRHDEHEGTERETRKENPEGAIYSRVKPLKERDERRGENAFLQKLSNKRSDVKMHMTIGGKKRKGGRWRKLSYGIGVLIILGILAYIFLPRVVVKITPRTKIVTLSNQQFSASLGATTTDVLLFKPITLTATATGTAPAAGSKTISEKASGKLTIYNTTQKQMSFIPKTRFESPDGKIYRVGDAVDIPAMTGSTPGQVTVTVTADKPGAGYNQKASTEKFMVPGLKGTEYYHSFYAKMQGPFTGGYEGEKKIVSKGDLDALKQKLSQEIGKQIAQKASSTVSSERILFNGAGDIAYTENVVGATGTKAVVKVTGTLSGVTFGKGNLASAIARKTDPNYKGGVVVASDWTGLSLTLPNASSTENGTAQIGGQISFTLTGVLPLQWQVDQKSVRQALSGQPKSDFQTILNRFYAIDHATTIMHPFWKSHFPKNPENIGIKIENSGSSGD